MIERINRVIWKALKPTIGEAAENIVWHFKKTGGYRLVNSNISYAQCGEDLIACWLMGGLLKGKQPSYMDIGANDPRMLSNTYLMYRNGGRGILVEPNTRMCKKLKKVRSGDTVVNCGVAEKKGKLTYYFMDKDVLNTFSKEEAERYVKFGRRIIEKKEIQVVTINDIMEKYGKVDFLSIDVEGKEFDILKALDFTRFAPLAICAETQEFYGTKRENFKEINEFLEQKGYMIFADTMLNTIYVDKKAYMDSLPD